MEAIVETGHVYAPGEEVVVKLDGVEAYNVERGGAVTAACLPSWTIGLVLERRTVDGGAAYAVRIAHDECACVCVVGEGAIEGTA
jgi:hypothetical protein